MKQLLRFLGKQPRRNVIRVFGMIAVATFLFIVLVYEYGFYHIIYFRQSQKMTKEILTALRSRNATELVEPGTDTTGLKPDFIIDKKSPPFAVIMVNSFVHNRERRNKIRRTWAKDASELGMVVWFFTGQTQPDDKSNYELVHEALMHNDLIMDDFMESYYKLTIKTLRMFKWFVLTVPSAQYLVKCDDDAFVDIQNMYQYLKSTVPGNVLVDHYFYGGEVYTGLRTIPVRNPFESCYAPRILWPGEESYPHFAGGLFYVLSGKMVQRLLDTSIHTLLYHLEDVFIGILAHSLGLSPVDIPGIYSSTRAWEFQYLNKSMLENMISYHCKSETFIIDILHSNAHNNYMLEHNVDSGAIEWIRMNGKLLLLFAFLNCIYQF